MNYFDMFKMCFPELEIGKEVFERISGIDRGVLLTHEIKGETAAFALVEQNALRLLCVLPEQQRKGIGTLLLAKAEQLIAQNGYSEIIVGGSSSELFIGAPSQSAGFFEKHGYVSDGTYDEMTRSMHDFLAEDFDLPVPQEVSFGWYNGGQEELHRAVRDVDEGWVQYFTADSRVFCGFAAGEIASFCLVDYDSECILSDGSNKVGVIGCVGTVHSFRRKGIGLKMVALASECLSQNDCDLCFIHYTGVSRWYAKLGYRTFLSQNMFRKTL